MKVFFDTNILMDVLTQRKPHYKNSARVWTLAERNKIQGIVSAISYPTVNYLLGKLVNRRIAERAMHILREIFNVEACTEQIVNQSIDARLKDFEDALQFYSALHADAEYLITRNPGHFPPSDMSIISPQEFLAAHSFA